MRLSNFNFTFLVSICTDTSSRVALEAWIRKISEYIHEILILIFSIISDITSIICQVSVTSTENGSDTFLKNILISLIRQDVAIQSSILKMTLQDTCVYGIRNSPFDNEYIIQQKHVLEYSKIKFCPNPGKKFWGSDPEFNLSLFLLIKR